MIDLYTLFILTRCHISRRFYSPIDMGYLLGTRGFFSNGFPFTLMTLVFPLSLCTYIHTHNPIEIDISHLFSLLCTKRGRTKSVELNWVCGILSFKKRISIHNCCLLCEKCHCLNSERVKKSFSSSFLLTQLSDSIIIEILHEFVLTQPYTNCALLR